MIDPRLAHRFCTNNKPQLKTPQKCGCFYCRSIFSSAEIEEWVPDTLGTAICPKCGIDSVIGESSGITIDQAFLTEMHNFWFRSKAR